MVSSVLVASAVKTKNKYYKKQDEHILKLKELTNNAETLINLHADNRELETNIINLKNSLYESNKSIQSGENISHNINNLSSEINRFYNAIELNKINNDIEHSKKVIKLHKYISAFKDLYVKDLFINMPNNGYSRVENYTLDTIRTFIFNRYFQELYNLENFEAYLKEQNFYENIDEGLVWFDDIQNKIDTYPVIRKNDELDNLKKDYEKYIINLDWTKHWWNNSYNIENIISNEPAVELIKQEAIKKINEIQDLRSASLEEALPKIHSFSDYLILQVRNLNVLNNDKINLINDLKEKAHQIEIDWQAVLNDLRKISEDPKYEILGLLNPNRLTIYKYIKNIMTLYNNDHETLKNLTIPQLNSIKDQIDKDRKIIDLILENDDSISRYRLDFQKDYDTVYTFKAPYSSYKDNYVYNKSIDSDKLFDEWENFANSMVLAYSYEYNPYSFYHRPMEWIVLENNENITMIKMNEVLLSIYDEVAELFNKTIDKAIKYYNENKQYENTNDFKIVLKQLKAVSETKLKKGVKWSYEDMVDLIEKAEKYIDKIEQLKSKHSEINNSN
ncbi:hypothetical protein [Mycoplasmopsis felifaucium]|uniref:Uncharacterized protein n=1 Tax=Mycoplasmopsis felifaucium TaxID=35768 RepID=A0ABZ2RRC5_9BACT